MSQSPALLAQKLAFQISPIILTNGIAQLMGGALPLVAITEALNFTVGLLSGTSDLDLDSFFASFAPLSGGKLIDIAVATVPFANQGVAANAIIQQPLRISLKMTCPARGDGGFSAKLATITALQASLALHTNQGGTFTVATPAFIYTNCLLTGLTDVSGGQPSQPQSIWQWDFYQPLLTADQLAGAQNTMMSKITGGLPSDGSLSGSSLDVNPADSGGLGQ
jgi:hypothetical protein